MSSLRSLDAEVADIFGIATPHRKVALQADVSRAVRRKMYGKRGP